MAKGSKGRAKTPWTKKELDYLSEHYGQLPDDILAQRLGRSREAIKLTVTRKLGGVRRTSAFYTARMLASILGRKDPKAIVVCIKRGWLKAAKGPPSAGPTKMWNITEDDIVTLLKQHPWVADLNRMEQHYFRSIVRDEWKRDPWYNSTEAALRLGVKTPAPILRYIRKGWLTAEKQPVSPKYRGWVIRKSAIQAFLKNDPRKEHKSQLCRAIRIRSNLKLGIATRLTVIWQLECPSCHKKVTISAPPWMLGRQVKATFLASYTNGSCSHGSSCSIQTDYSNTIDFTDLAPLALRENGSYA